MSTRTFPEAHCRASIVATAAHLEASPTSLDRSTIYIPVEPSDRADTLSWIGFFLGVRGHAETSGAAARALGLRDTQEFYARMVEIDEHWESDAIRCAAALREYVAQHYGDER